MLSVLKLKAWRVDWIQYKNTVKYFDFISARSGGLVAGIIKLVTASKKQGNSFGHKMLEGFLA